MNHAEHNLEVSLAPELQRIFFMLLQEGVVLEVKVGGSIQQLLVEQFGIAADYLASRITTIFLNNKPVDDAATAVIPEDCVLALSGAMPGLVGATLRTGSHLAAMRGSVTFANEAQASGMRPGCIKLKLFNLLLAEIGPRVLQHGILLKSCRLRSFLAEQPTELRFKDCHIDGQGLGSMAVADLLQKEMLFADDETQVKLKVYFGD